MLIAGDKDIAGDAVSFRYRTGVERRGVPLDEAIDEISRTVAERRSDVGSAGA
jgi:threonyl-tRNA synthetase